MAGELLPHFLPPPGFHIHRDVGGVPGLLLATEVFSEAAERVFFETTAHLSSGKETKRTGEWAARDPSRFPPNFWMALNAIRDSGLMPQFLDSCVPAVAVAVGGGV